MHSKWGRVQSIGNFTFSKIICPKSSAIFEGYLATKILSGFQIYINHPDRQAIQIRNVKQCLKASFTFTESFSPFSHDLDTTNNCRRSWNTNSTQFGEPSQAREPVFKSPPFFFSPFSRSSTTQNGGRREKRKRKGDGMMKLMMMMIDIAGGGQVYSQLSERGMNDWASEADNSVQANIFLPFSVFFFSLFLFFRSF